MCRPSPRHIRLGAHSSALRIPLIKAEAIEGEDFVEAEDESPDGR